MPRNTPIQFRRGTSTEWTNENPVLISGEPGFDVTNDVLKIGDGSTSWTGLSEFAPFNTNLIAGSGISLVYNSGNSTLSINSSGTGGGLANIVEDLTPQLGGNLDLNSSSITGVGNINISGDITANTGNLDVLSFNVNNESILTKGQISWDDTEGTMDIGLTDNTTIHIGEHRYFRIRNETGDTLYKGQVVYATGVHSNGLITPAKYVADGTVREVRFMGVVLENVNHNNNGYVIDFGHLENMDLDGSATNYAVGDETWSAGDILYVHPTVAGKLTKNEPKHGITVAIILDAGNGNGNGRMFVRPTSYGHLDDNHDVAVSGATNGQFLQYNSVTDYWVPSSSGNFTTLQVNGTGVSVSGHVHTTGDISNFASGVADVISTNLLPGTGIIFDYDSEADTLTVNNSRPLSKTINVFTPALNQPPATGFATIDTRNSILVLDFDDGADNEAAIFVGVIPDGMSTASGIYANIYWTATTATSGQCRWGVAFEKTDGDIDTDDFDTATEDHTTVNSTNGIPTKTTILCTNIDNLIANDMFRLKIYRDSSDTTNDTLVGDVELIAVELQTVN